MRDHMAQGLRRAWAEALGRVARISESEADVARRGFVVARLEAARRIEQIGVSFVYGYNLAVGAHDLDRLGEQLAAVPAADAGFVYEGAAMGVAVADFCTPGRRMFEALLMGPAAAHEYMAWVGRGWALARLPLAPEPSVRRCASLNAWLSLDGYGFHEGYFNWPSRIQRQRWPRGLSPQGRQIFDQGLGRSLWFVWGAEVDAIVAQVDAFSAPRRADLWAGVGLAAAYAGGCAIQDLERLEALCGPHLPALAQGVVFAAEARLHAGNMVQHVEDACTVILRVHASQAGELAVRARPSSGTTIEDYQQWRHAIQANCAALLARPAFTP
jgi:hypothetical protein